jgi:hypothetical protein
MAIKIDKDYQSAGDKFRVLTQDKGFGRGKSERGTMKDTRQGVMTMTQEQVYTFEHYRPAYPETGDYVVVHRGTFEDNRDLFSPSLVRARDFYAVDDADALLKAEQAAATIPALFQGFNDAE